MKSRVINTKHLIEHTKGYTGYCSKLKPSLFYGDPKTESHVFLQDKHTNKMAKFVLDEIKGQEKGMIWIYKPTQKFVDKFPHLEGKTLTIHFDLWQTHPFAIKKRAGLVKTKGWKKREYAEKEKEKVRVFKEYFNILGYPLEETSQDFTITFPTGIVYKFLRTAIKKSNLPIYEFVEYHLKLQEILQKHLTIS